MQCIQSCVYVSTPHIHYRLQKYCIVAPQLIALALAFVAYLAVTQDGQTAETLGHDAYLNGPNRDPKVNGHNRAVMYPGEENRKWGKNTTDFLR